MGRCVYSLQSTSNALYSHENWCWEKTWDGEFKLLWIRELDSDDVDGKPDSTDEDTPPNFSIGLWIVVRCEADIGSIIWKLKFIQVNVMQKSLVYWKWPNVVDIYCKCADAIKRIY